MILTSGAFDGVHAGHVQYLEAAKALCEGEEVLVCAIAPDDYIAAVKGRAPYWHQGDRLRTVHALACVDAVLPQQPLSVAPFIRQYRPRLFVKGPDWQDRLPEDVLLACDDVGTDIVYVNTPGTHVAEAKPTDAQALAAFEALVLSQQPATQPWQPVTDYSFEARKAIEGPHPRLILDVLAPRRIIDIGCGPEGHLVRLLTEERPGRPHDPCGMDPQIPDSRWPLFRGDILTATITANPYHAHELEARGYDLVICREVLEHLIIRDVRRAVGNLCALSSRYVYVTTRFAQQPAHLLSVDTADELDPTHITMLNQALLRTLFVLEGFKRRADLEEQLDWQRKGRCLVYERP